VSEYTPTTDEIRGIYRGSLIQTGSNIYALIGEAQADAEFNRWFESNMQKMQIAERERIIKLLEEAIEDDEDQYRLGWAITLIKGENK
jgi:hypothetical protein